MSNSKSAENPFKFGAHMQMTEGAVARKLIVEKGLKNQSTY